MCHIHDNDYYYYTSEEFFLYKITVDKRTIHHFSRQNELLTGTRGAFHFNGKTGIASIATVAANGKHVAGWRFW